MLLFVLLAFVAQFAAWGDETAAPLEAEPPAYNATWAHIRRHYGPQLDFWGHVELRVRRVLYNSQCLTRGGGESPEYEYCFGCDTRMARKCIDDMRSNISMNVPPGCEMRAMGAFRQPVCCATFEDENDYRSMDLKTGAYNDALLCLTNLGCADSKYYYLVQDECHYQGCDVIPVAAEDDYETIYDDDEQYGKWETLPAVDDDNLDSGNFMKRRQKEIRDEIVPKKRRKKQHELDREKIVNGYMRSKWFEPDGEHYRPLETYLAQDAELANSPKFPPSLRHRKRKHFNEKRRLNGNIVDGCRVSEEYELLHYKRNFGHDDDNKYYIHVSRAGRGGKEAQRRQDRYWSRKLNEDDEIRHYERKKLLKNLRAARDLKPKLGKPVTSNGFFDDDDPSCDDDNGPCTNFGHQIIWRTPARCYSCTPTNTKKKRGTLSSGATGIQPSLLLTAVACVSLSLGLGVARCGV